MQREPRRWRTRFGRWVQAYGVRRLTTDLQRTEQPVTEKAVYEWLAGRRIPRPERALAVTRLAQGRLKLADVYEHREQLLRAKCSAVIR